MTKKEVLFLFLEMGESKTNFKDNLMLHILRTVSPDWITTILTLLDVVSLNITCHVIESWFWINCSKECGEIVNGVLANGRAPELKVFLIWGERTKKKTLGCMDRTFWLGLQSPSIPHTKVTNFFSHFLPNLRRLTHETHQVGQPDLFKLLLI